MDPKRKTITLQTKPGVTPQKKIVLEQKPVLKPVKAKLKTLA